MRFKRDIIVVGASAGGVEALQRLVTGLPEDLPAAVFIVLHIWAGANSMLPSILGRASRLPVRHPADGDPIENGTVYVAPPDFHMLLEPDRIVIVRGPRENCTRPAVNPLFRSAAAAFGPRVIGVVLTGMLDDGTAGLWSVKRRGGTAVVQRPDEALFPDMPQNALENVNVDHSVTLMEIPGVLVHLVNTPIEAPESVTVPDNLRVINEGSKMIPHAIDADQPGQRSLFTCPDCGGIMWETESAGRPMQYRCHVGHAFSPLGLMSAQQTVVEQSLWSALRALKESAGLDEKLAERTAAQGLDKASASYRKKSDEKRQQADHMLQFLRSLGNSRAGVSAESA